MRVSPPEILGAVAAMRSVCERRDTDLTTAALQCSLREPRFASTIVALGRIDRHAGE